MKKVLLIAAMLVCMYPLFAQNPTDTLTIDDFYVDYSIPDLTALGLLGIQNDEIVRPGNMKEFALAISNFVDTDGSLKPALAMEWSFMRTLSKGQMNWNRAFQPRNLAISMATTNQDSLGTRMGIGLKWVPFDKSEPIADESFMNLMAQLGQAYFQTDAVQDEDNYNDELLAIFNWNNQGMTTDERQVYFIMLETLSYQTLDANCKAMKKGVLTVTDTTFLNTIEEKLERANLSNIITPDQLNEAVKLYKDYLLNYCANGRQSFESYISAILQREKERYKKEHWNAFAWEVSAGWVGHSVSANYDDFEIERLSVFTGVSLPFLSKNKGKYKGQLIGQLKYDVNSSSDTLALDGYSAGMRALYGNSDNRISLDLFYADQDAELISLMETRTTTYLRYTIGTELKLTDGSWLEIAFGGQKFYEGESEANRVLANFGLKHTIRPKKRFN